MLFGDSADESEIYDLGKIPEWILRDFRIEVFKIHKTVFNTIGHHFVSIGISDILGRMRELFGYFPKTLTYIRWYSGLILPFFLGNLTGLLVIHQGLEKCCIVDIIFVICHLM